MMNGLSKWTVALYLTAIFSAGAVSGWVIAAKTAKQRLFSAPKPSEIADSLRQRYESHLNLTPDQATQFEAIIVRSSREMQAIHGESLKRIRLGVSNRNAQIAAILTPEQRKEFERLEKERADSWRNKDSRRGKDGNRDGGRDWKRGPRDQEGTNSTSRVPGGRTPNNPC